VVGAIGGIMGGKAGANMDNQIGDKITVTLDSGKTISVVQARDKAQPIMPGERVVVESGSTTSVVREVPTKDPDYTAAKVKSKW
jgi:outer membrane lipoprotein SlyB